MTQIGTKLLTMKNLTLL